MKLLLQYLMIKIIFNNALCFLPHKHPITKQFLQPQRLAKYSKSVSKLRVESASPLEEMNPVINQDRPALSPPPAKQHTVTVCLVPPPIAEEVWTAVTKARIELRDPGLYRWPPHANLIYPFLSLRSAMPSMEEQEEPIGSDNRGGKAVDPDIVQHLRNATKHIEPFSVSLETLGTFGGNHRGVLWLYPRSFRDEQETSLSSSDNTSSPSIREPLYELQELLVKEFPTCKDQSKQRDFSPHITLSHFPSLEEAEVAKDQIKTWWSGQTFLCTEIYLLERRDDNGQFLRVATLKLGEHNGGHNGSDGNGIVLHDPPEAFPAMPTVEEEWVRDERMKMKERRNRSGRRRGPQRARNGAGKTRTNRDSRGTSRIIDTPEIIEQKRADRKAKRERLEREQL